MMPGLQRRTVHDGQIETGLKSDKVRIAASYDRALLFNSGLFGGTFTEAVTRTV
jgi:hypothetical protein